MESTFHRSSHPISLAHGSFLETHYSLVTSIFTEIRDTLSEYIYPCDLATIDLPIDTGSGAWQRLGVPDGEGDFHS